MRKFTYICSCIVIALVLASTNAEAIDYNTATAPAGTRPIKMTRPVEKTQMNIQETTMASRGGQMSKRAEFKEKLQEMSDANKQARVEKIDTRIASVNAAQTAKWMETLTKMEALLAKFTAQEASLKASGKNTTALASAIASAQTAVTTAKTAVNAQASKEYVINITSETALKTNVGSTVSLFKTDTRTTRQTVIAARTALVKAFEEWAKLSMDSMNSDASNSGAMRVQ